MDNGPGQIETRDRLPWSFCCSRMRLVSCSSSWLIDCSANFSINAAEDLSTLLSLLLLLPTIWSAPESPGLSAEFACGIMFLLLSSPSSPPSLLLPPPVLLLSLSSLSSATISGSSSCAAGVSSSRRKLRAHTLYSLSVQYTYCFVHGRACK